MPILIKFPNNCNEERLYTAKFIFGEILGTDYECQFEERKDVAVGHADRWLFLDDTFFQHANRSWLTMESLPTRPVPFLTLDSDFDMVAKTVTPEIPVLFGRKLDSGKWVEFCEKSSFLGLDVFGSIFFLLSRYEEVVSQERDSHNRFLARHSIQDCIRCVERPLVNEYGEFLWNCLSRVLPGLERRKREFRLLPSHDVDTVRCWTGKSLPQIAVEVRQVASRIRSERSLRPLTTWVLTKSLGEKHDPYNTFDRLMHESERRNLRSAFYFIAGHSHPQTDPDYLISDLEMRRLLQIVHKRGHEIGLHPSYGCYLSPERTGAELRMLRAVCEEEGIMQETFGGRQHFLRYSHPQTALIYDNLGLEYDSSLGFADRAGFRCGVCHEFPIYDVIARGPLRLRERPLIVMDCTVTDTRYMGLGNTERAFELIARLKDRCRMFGGDFSILWHNSRLTQAEDWELYCAVLDH